jgi:EAL domain-containing protein (putative c-di-GMP-specific phosphodiesterase class I)
MAVTKGSQTATCIDRGEYPGLDELTLHFQPQVSLDDGVVIGFEALNRWQHPQRGLLPPAAFLPALEASALALPVGWWVLDTACAQLATWRSGGGARRADSGEFVCGTGALGGACCAGDGGAGAQFAATRDAAA